MELIKPRTMPGVMELLPSDQISFQKMLDVIRENYERFGFLPIETPVMEFTDVLLKKTGGDTERQIYFAQSNGARELGREPDLSLRFDLTVPLARYVAEHENRLNFPFRRYQIQRVYRGETAQKGRFREFYQCDIDVVGKDRLNLKYDAEIPAVIYRVFKELGVGKFTIHINNRKILMGFFQDLGLTGELGVQVMREVDKLDKRGRDKVIKTLTEDLGVAREKVDKLMTLVLLKDEANRVCLEKLEAMTIDQDLFREGVREIGAVIGMMESLGVPDDYFCINPGIARGLDYYTGTVYETLLDEHPKIGSVCSGGRYDNLAGYYTKSHLPGVGISIGATRLFYQLTAAGLIDTSQSLVQALVLNMDEDHFSRFLALATRLREGGIRTEVFMDPAKIGKQFKHADRSGIRFAVLQGEDEFARNAVTIKDLHKSEQFETPIDEVVAAIRQRLCD